MHLKYDDKGQSGQDALTRQEANRQWWTDHTMSYDWKDGIRVEKYTKDWFDEIDSRFCHDARLYAGTENPFATLMNLSQLSGKRVLEIGCGMGFHSELLARSGAIVTSIDLSPTSVQATKQRMQLHGLSSDVREMDAEKLEFADQTFDLVWSWGVIHHSSSTVNIVSEVNRVLKPSGEFRFMVYYLGGMSAYITIIRRYLLGFWRGKDLDNLLWADTDGYTARYYSKDALRELLVPYFSAPQFTLCGQDPDVVPLPRMLRRWILPLYSEAKRVAIAARRGSMIFAAAAKR